MYSSLLLEPDSTWFALWRHNCVLAADHSATTRSASYRLEDKGVFLLTASSAGIPVSPFLRLPRGLVVKHVSQEGGLGIAFYDDFSAGGSWVLQERLTNAPELAALLPPHAPLSTLRVVTAAAAADAAAPAPAAASAATTTGSDISVVTVVLRAGRSGASTDHASILFDVDPATGRLGHGVSNSSWYLVGLRGALSSWTCGGPAAQGKRRWTSHPDNGVRVTGRVLPDLHAALELCTSAHRRLMPDVPLVGWDVALTAEAGACLLELNISLNFFCGSFDRPAYAHFMLDHFAALERLRRGSKLPPAEAAPPPPASKQPRHQVEPAEEQGQRGSPANGPGLRHRHN